MEWVRDAVVESTPLSTTGGHTWAAAYRLAAYLAATSAQLGLDAPGVNLLELGAGTGWLGVTLARNLPAAALVWLTEQEEGVPWLRHNVELNRAAGLPLGSVRVAACDWRHYAAAAAAAPAAGGEQQPSSGGGSGGGIGESPGCDAQQEQQQHSPGAADPSGAAGSGSSGLQGTPGGDATSGGSQGSALPLHRTRWDFIVGSDLIYNEVGSRCLPRVLASLATAGATQILYCHTKHRFDLLDQEFFEQLAACGLHCEEVWEPDAPPPPSSPPPQFPPLDLFPEQRIAVFRITKPAAAAA